MSEGTLEERAAERGAGIAMGILWLLSGANFFLLWYIVPKFEQIFADALPGKPLPPLTEFIIRERMLLVFFVLALPIPALIMFWRSRPYAILWINLGIVWFILMAGSEVIALFMPMAGGLSGR